MCESRDSDYNVNLCPMIVYYINNLLKTSGVGCCPWTTQPTGQLIKKNRASEPFTKMFEISIYEFLLIKLKLPQTGKIQKLIVEIVKSCLDFYDELKSFKAILKSCLFI